MKAVYPGSFDPATNGHLDILTRAARVFDTVLVTVARNPAKTPLFTMDERMAMLQVATAGLPNIEVHSFDGLLIEFVQAHGAQVIVKGLRAMSDFENEFQMALMNKKLEPTVETMFMMTANAHSYLSSSVVKELARLGGCVTGLVPDVVEEQLKIRFAEEYGGRKKG